MKNTIVFFVCLALLLFCGCKSAEYTFAHDADAIVRIELLHNKNPYAYHYEDCDLYVLRELQEDEISTFMHALYDIERRNVFGPPLYGYGDYIARVFYENGDIEMLGSSHIEFVPAGGSYRCETRDLFYPKQAFLDVFMSYEDISAVVTELHQFPDDVDHIELLDTRFNGETVLYTVTGDDIQPFLSDLNELRFFETEPDPEPKETQEDTIFQIISDIDTQGLIPYLLEKSLSDSSDHLPPFRPLAVKVCYKNGYYDVLDNLSSAYFAPDGTEVELDLHVYLANAQDFFTLFSKYIGEENMPPIHYN